MLGVCYDIHAEEIRLLVLALLGELIVRVDFDLTVGSQDHRHREHIFIATVAARPNLDFTLSSNRFDNFSSVDRRTLRQTQLRKYELGLLVMVLVLVRLSIIEYEHKS